MEKNQEFYLPLLSLTLKFETLNFNLKRIIFSFLNLNNQRKIYWSNKKLRPFLPASINEIKFKHYKKVSSYELELEYVKDLKKASTDVIEFESDEGEDANEKDEVKDILELADESLVIWTQFKIYLIKITKGTDNFELIKTKKLEVPVEEEYGFSILNNLHIISKYGLYDTSIRIYDKDFNLIQNINGFNEDEVISICNICTYTYAFAAGFYSGRINIYYWCEINSKYQIKKQIVFHSHPILCLLHSPTYDLLIAGSEGRDIHYYYDLSQSKLISEVPFIQSRLFSSK